MQRYKHLPIRSTSTAEVVGIFRDVLNKAIVLVGLEGTGGHANSKLTLYPTTRSLRTIVTDGIASTTVLTYVDVDVAAGHVIKGHTMTTNDYIVVVASAGATAEGLALRSPSAVGDEAGETYCKLTVSSLTVLPPKKSPVWIVPTASVKDIVIGSSVITRDHPIMVVDAGCPMVIGATSGDATDTDLALVGEYVDG